MSEFNSENKNEELGDDLNKSNGDNIANNIENNSEDNIGNNVENIDNTYDNSEEKAESDKEEEAPKSYDSYQYRTEYMNRLREREQFERENSWQNQQPIQNQQPQWGSSYPNGGMYQPHYNPYYGGNYQSASQYGTPQHDGGHDSLQSGQKPPQSPLKKIGMDKKIQSKSKSIYTLVIVFAFIASFAGTLIADFISYNGGFSGDNVVVYKSVSAPKEAENQTVSQVAEAVSDSVVEIYTEAVTSKGYFGNYVTEGAGSGVVMSEDGYIITNNHVIEGAISINVRLSNGDVHSATLVGTDKGTDVAVIKISANNLQPAVFANSDNIIVGEEVVAVGNPLGELGGSVTNGIISALDRQIVVDGYTMTLLQTNAAINPGNSGGGLFNMNGEIVGIVNAKNTGEDIDNIGFAIPSNIALELAQDFIEHGHAVKPAIGISVVNIETVEEARGHGLSRPGVYIMESSNDQLKNGDLVLSVENHPIVSTTDIANAIADKEVGDKITMQIMRGTKYYELEIVLVQSNA